MLKLIPPSGPPPPDDARENARIRGVQVDTMLSAWLGQGLTDFPAGVYREDSAELFVRLTQWSWFDAHDISGTQVILSDDEIAGTADIIGADLVADLKTVYDLQPTYGVQLGGYCHLFNAQYGRFPKECGIIHATKRFKEPKWVPFEVATVVSEFRVLRDFWRLCQRKTRTA